MFVLRTLGWSWCVLLYQVLSFQVSPEFRRYLGLHGGVVCENLLFTAGADDQSCGHVRRRRELKRCCAKIYSVIRCYCPQLFSFFQEVGGYLVGVFSIVVSRTPRDESSVQ